MRLKTLSISIALSILLSLYPTLGHAGFEKCKFFVSARLLLRNVSEKIEVKYTDSNWKTVSQNFLDMQKNYGIGVPLTSKEMTILRSALEGEKSLESTMILNLVNNILNTETDLLEKVGIKKLSDYYLLKKFAQQVSHISNGGLDRLGLNTVGENINNFFDLLDLSKIETENGNPLLGASLLTYYGAYYRLDRGLYYRFAKAYNYAISALYIKDQNISLVSRCREIQEV
ncbi:MAG: hypothetical protein QE271_14595 [Bacteriovoracaceae bacterium]|nr:hypothetical protein [Bacteriovoracaceae bacterium]